MGKEENGLNRLFCHYIDSNRFSGGFISATPRRTGVQISSRNPSGLQIAFRNESFFSFLAILKIDEPKNYPNPSGFFF